MNPAAASSYVAEERLDGFKLVTRIRPGDIKKCSCSSQDLTNGFVKRFIKIKFQNLLFITRFCEIQDKTLKLFFIYFLTKHQLKFKKKIKIL